MKFRIPVLSCLAALALACGGGEVSEDGMDPVADSKTAAVALCACMEEGRPRLDEAVAEALPEEKELMKTYVWGMTFTKCQITTRTGESDVAHPAFAEALMATCPEFKPQLDATVGGSEMGGALAPFEGGQ